jgi:hypothetical protein
MCKTNANASIIVKKAIKEMEKNHNLSIRQRLNKIADKFLNSAEVSAPECVYTLLSMNVCRSSRDMVFINTFPIKDRLLLLQDYRILKEKKEDSTDVFKHTLHDYYANRPRAMENMCLAEFAGYYEFVSNTLYAQLASGKLPRFPDEEDNRDDDEPSSSDDEQTKVGDTNQDPSQQNQKVE